MHQRQMTTRRTAVSLIALTGMITAIGLAPATATDHQADPRPVARCSSGVPGDVNGDGFAEVAVGEPGNAKGRGSVHVFYGQRSGLVTNATGSARNDHYLTQDTRGVPGKAETGDAFGTSTLLADFNGDGCADLAVGSPGENDGTGWVQVFFGSPTGLKTSGTQSFTLSQIPGSPGSARDQELGDELAAGDLDGDGIDDLVAGISGLHVDGKDAAGGVAVVYGGLSGLQLTRSAMLTRDTPGIPGESGKYVGFGAAVATGDFDGDGSAELAIGSTNGLSGGTVQTVERTPDGFTGSEPISPHSAGMPGEADRFCAFGFVLASGDVHGDGRDDLAVGDPAFGCHDEPDVDYAMGSVVLLAGSKDGLTTSNSQLWTQDSPGVAGTARLGNVFSEALAMAPLDEGPTADLVIGAPGDTDGGSVTVLLGGPDGLTTEGIGGTRFTQATRGIPGTPESEDAFGEVVTTPHLQSRTQATLVIGVPREDVGSIRSAGAITQLPISADGPNPRGAKTFTANTSGVQGKTGTDERFGGGPRRWG